MSEEPYTPLEQVQAEGDPYNDGGYTADQSGGGGYDQYDNQQYSAGEDAGGYENQNQNQNYYQQDQGQYYGGGGGGGGGYGYQDPYYQQQPSYYEESRDYQTTEERQMRSTKFKAQSRAKTAEHREESQQRDQIELRIVHACEKFERISLGPMEPRVNAMCHGVVSNRYISVSDQKYLETELARIYNFLASLESYIKKPPPAVKPIHPKFPENPMLSRCGRAQWTAEELAAMAELKQRIKDAKARLRSQRQEINHLKREIQDFMADIEARRKKILEKLASVQPALDRAIEGVNAINPKQLFEISSYATPPPMVGRVMEAVLVLIGEPRAKEWDIIKSYMTRKDFIPTVRDFRGENVTPEVKKKVRKITAAPDFTYENAHKASRAVAPLLLWVVAMIDYMEALLGVKPLQDELARLDAQMRELQEELERRNKRSSADEVKDLQQQLKDQYNDEELARRQAELQRQEEAANRDVVDAYRQQCQAEQDRCDAFNSRIKEPMAAGWMETHTKVVACRERCNTIVKAIIATMESLGHGFNQKPLVIQRGRLHDIKDRTYNARGLSPAEEQRRQEKENAARGIHNTPPAERSKNSSPARGSPARGGSPMRVGSGSPQRASPARAPSAAGTVARARIASSPTHQYGHMHSAGARRLANGPTQEPHRYSPMRPSQVRTVVTNTTVSCSPSRGLNSSGSGYSTGYSTSASPRGGHSSSVRLRPSASPLSASRSRRQQAMVEDGVQSSSSNRGGDNSQTTSLSNSYRYMDSRHSDHFGYEHYDEEKCGGLELTHHEAKLSSMLMVGTRGHTPRTQPDGTVTDY